MKRHLSATALLLCASVAFSLGESAFAGTPVVPGTGELLNDCCDDFEDTSWSYKYNLPKSSYEQDEAQRGPGGRSSNGLWHEGGKRGTPDVVKRVPTPPGGLAGSQGALLFATKNSGVPGKISNEQQQDDLLMLFNRRLGRSIPMAWQPSCTVRVYLPEWDKWEQRNGPSFGMRCDCQGRNPDGSVEEYWPGMFIVFHKKSNKEGDTNHAQLTLRGDKRGHDVHSLEMNEPGWWTLGMSYSADGQIHYFAHEGVADLTADDFLMSSFPYNQKCITFDNFFFNVANWDNGHTWSTPWVIDDPKIYAVPPQGQTIAQLYKEKKAPPKQQQRPQQQQVTKNSQQRTLQQPDSVDKTATQSSRRTQR
jgi:hypothetical protein